MLNGGAHLVPEGELRELYLFFANQPNSIEFTGGAHGGMQLTGRGKEAHMQLFENEVMDGDHARRIERWVDAKMEPNPDPEKIKRLYDESRLTIPMLLDKYRRENSFNELAAGDRQTVFRTLSLQQTGKDPDNLQPGETVAPDLGLPTNTLNSIAAEADKSLSEEFGDESRATLFEETLKAGGGSVHPDMFRPLQQKKRGWIGSVLDYLKTFANWLWKNKNKIIAFIVAAIFIYMIIDSLDHTGLDADQKLSKQQLESASLVYFRSKECKRGRRV